MMSTETAPEETEEDKQLPQCGRLVFRGAELAYLNIDGEYMMPLAELLALVLPSTPRTTLFTRMEKMKVRRHFCQPEEIKLLKTVNGIHGSSANCTLLSKTEVDKYCSMYIDKPSELNGESTGDTNTEQVASEDSCVENVRKDKEETESTHQNNSATPNKLALLDKHKKSTPLKPKLKLTKVATAKNLNSRYSPDCQVNKTLTDNTSRAAIDGDLTSGSVNECGEGCLLASSSSEDHVNSSHTQSVVELGANKKRVKNRDKSSEANKKMRKVAGGKKGSSDDLDIKEAFESPLKIPKRSELNGHIEESDKVNGTSQFRSSLCNNASVKKQDHFDALISDSSSNDSGFASTALSNASTPTKTDFSAGELSGLLRKDEDTIKKHASSPPCNLKLKTPKKNKAKGNHGKSLTLSPPALLLKRFEDSWLVEEKSPVNDEVTNCLHKPKVKPRKRALFEEVCGPAKPLFQQKQVNNEKKRRKPLTLKEEIGSEPLVTKDLILGERQGAGITTKKKFKRKQKGKLPNVKARKEQTLLNGQIIGPEKSSDFSTAKDEQKLECLPVEDTSPKCKLDIDKQTEEELLKKDAVLERLASKALAKFFAPSTSVTTPSTDVMPTKVSKPKPKKPKVATITKSVQLKTNCSFQILNLFPSTSLLTLQDGVLSPSFTMSCPKGVQPHSSHPLWNWHIGGPVVRSPPKSLKPAKTVQKEPLSRATLITNEVQKLKRIRRRKKPSTNNSLALASVSNSVASNETIADSKQSVSIAPEFKVPVCVASFNSIVSSAAVKVS